MSLRSHGDTGSAAGSPASRLTPDELAEADRARAARPLPASTTRADRQRMLDAYPVLKAAAEAWARRGEPSAK